MSGASKPLLHSQKAYITHLFYYVVLGTSVDPQLLSPRKKPPLSTIYGYHFHRRKLTHNAFHVCSPLPISFAPCQTGNVNQNRIGCGKNH